MRALLEPATVNLPGMNVLPPVLIHHPHIDIDHSGSPIIAGTRVPVRRVWRWHRLGTPVATLLLRYPALKPSQVLSALAFAYDNRDLVEADLAREESLLGTAHVLELKR